MRKLTSNEWALLSSSERYNTLMKSIDEMEGEDAKTLLSQLLDNHYNTLSDEVENWFTTYE